MTTMQAADNELVNRAQAGEEAAFTEIVNLYSDKLFTLLVRMLRDRTEAEDALQETFLTLVEKIDTFKGNSRLYTWLYRIASNIALMKIRSRGGRIQVDIDESTVSNQVHSGDYMTIPENPEEKLNKEQLGEVLDSAVKKLPPNFRQVFILRDIEQISGRETAEILGISEDNVKTRLRRARMALRDLLSEAMQ